MAEDDEDAREERLRRIAERRGLTLMKSPRSDPRESGHGTYMLVETDTATIKVSGSSAGFGLTLDEIEDVLNRWP